MGMDEDAKATANLGVLCTKKDLDPSIKREAKVLLQELKRRKELGRASTAFTATPRVLPVGALGLLNHPGRALCAPTTELCFCATRSSHAANW